jgi:hypothetical protein
MSYSRKLRKHRASGLYIGPTLSHSSPKNSRRGCLCLDSNTYSTTCCEGYLINQGIGRINAIPTIPGPAFSNGFSSGFDTEVHY